MGKLIKEWVKGILTEDIEKKVVVYAGRFQPFHKGHKNLFLNALKKSGQVAILVMDSYNVNKKNVMANKNELNYFIDRLVSVLDNTNFFNPNEKRKVMINNIEAIFTRNNLTLQELNTLHGIISSIIRS